MRPHGRVLWFIQPPQAHRALSQLAQAGHQHPGIVRRAARMGASLVWGQAWLRIEG